MRLLLKLTLYETDLEDLSPAATVFTVPVQYLFFYSMWLTSELNVGPLKIARASFWCTLFLTAMRHDYCTMEGKTEPLR